MRRGYGALQRRLLAILNTEDRVFETYTLVADAFDVKADEDGLRLISTAQMSAARRALRGLVRDGAAIELRAALPEHTPPLVRQAHRAIARDPVQAGSDRSPDTPRSGR